MTEEEKAIIMYRLHGCAKQYAISKVENILAEAVEAYQKEQEKKEAST